jgi:hypothetical protein
MFKAKDLDRKRRPPIRDHALGQKLPQMYDRQRDPRRRITRAAIKIIAPDNAKSMGVTSLSHISPPGNDPDTVLSSAALPLLRESHDLSSVEFGDAEEEREEYLRRDDLDLGDGGDCELGYKYGNNDECKAKGKGKGKGLGSEAKAATTIIDEGGEKIFGAYADNMPQRKRLRE